MQAPFDASAIKTQKFGAQLVEAQKKMAEDDYGISVIDMRQTMEQDIAKKLESFVDENTKKYPGRSFYILCYMGKDLEAETVIRLVLQARWTVPEPQPSTFVYIYNHHVGLPELIWSLPPEYALAKIKSMPWEYDLKLVQWVDQYFDNTLAKKYVDFLSKD